ncbi:maltose ABC transporter substrate-binding protein [Turicibacter sanguinis]|uniref:sugar ABC transporter substrate-binding protein n=1 Tax=Turicibacter sanguinis TaxID=154288 RepID=UPI001B5A3C7A|nr:maltose ABC transporter substrate-binding protein [Turicibacter sanguinis]MBP3908060.1 maltose ABC transporter substrate-binding protein [Turicibacter sp.]MDB8574080.1 maltose ABC transporter substrate-binding protein [Turicibacter sanguinis]MDB8577536.1 maltose ABC transporter substrate-binding protein [Turicibacter sanguinis]MDB8583262.1 maltose ABC transporter substrate-binding protein [Turicibacter sanguinis]MDB8585728.1 maltose ABC transporter substrate-binding protein [Turicibacter sa
MKKLIWLGLIAALSVTGLVACSGNETTPKMEETDSTATKVETPQEKIELKLWLDNDSWAEAMEKGIEEALPNIDIIYENVGAVDARSKIELDGPAGLGGDIFIQTQGGMGLSIESNILLPLGDDIEQDIIDRFLEGSVTTVKMGDDYYGVPLLTESLALFYNKTLLDENNFEVATSIEMMKEQAQAYNNTSENKFLFRFQPGNSYDMHFFLTGAGFELFGPNHDDPTQPNFDTPEFVAGLEEFASMREYLPVPAGDLNHDTTTAEFAKGNVPYIVTGPWAIAEIKEGSETNGFEWGVTTIPMINGVQPRTHSGNIIACISSYTKYPAEAREVLKFLSSEEGLQLTYDATGKIPALKDNSAIEGVMEDSYIAGILAQAAHTDPRPTIPEMKAFWGPAETAFKAVWDGVSTPEEAAKKAMEEYNTVLQTMQ